MNDENLKVLLILLEKAEQILSIINLPDSAINKYNQLKELTFDKLSLDFQPLVKRTAKMAQASLNNNDSFNWEYIHRLRLLNHKKNLFIDYLLELSDKSKFEGHPQMRNVFLKKDPAEMTSQLERIYSLNTITGANVRSLDDLEFEMKLEEIKLRDFIGKGDICTKNFFINVKYGGTGNNNFSSDGNIDDIIAAYDQKFEDMKAYHEKELMEFRERFAALKTKYNPDLESDYFKLRSLYDEDRFIIEKINEMTTPIYEKYYQKNVSWYENERVDMKLKELEKLNFLISLVNRFFSDNKYLIELVSTLEKEKNGMTEERNLPFVMNAIKKNDILREIYEESQNVESNEVQFHKSLEQLIDYINKNIENAN